MKSKYITLTNPEFLGESTINLCWGSDSGCWIVHPNEKSKMISHMLVHDVQESTRHNRHKMAKQFNWTRYIDKYSKMYNLTITETEDT